MELNSDDGEAIVGCILMESAKQYVEALEAAKAELDFLKKKKKSGRRGTHRSYGPPKVHVHTLYKKKADKVNPVDDVPSDGSVPDGDPFWKKKKWEEVKGRIDPDAPFAEYITPKFSDIPKGS